MEEKQKSLEGELKRWPPKVVWSKKRLLTILAGALLSTYFAFFTYGGYACGKNFLAKGYTPDKIEKEVKYQEAKYLPGALKALTRPGRELAYLLHYKEDSNKK